MRGAADGRGNLPRRFPAQGRPDAGNPRAAHRRGDGPPRRGLAGKNLRRARHCPPARNGRYRRARRVPKRGHGGGQPRALREQADRLSAPVQEQGAHLLPEPRRFRQPGELRQRSRRRQRPQLQGSQERQHQRFRAVQPQFLHPVQSADCLRAEGRRADQHARQRPHPRAALRRYPRRQAHVGKGARAEQRPPDPAGRGRGRHHRRDALSRDDQHHQLHSGGGYRRAGLCRVRNAAVFAGTEILLQPREDG